MLRLWSNLQKSTPVRNEESGVSPTSVTPLPGGLDSARSVLNLYEPTILLSGSCAFGAALHMTANMGFHTLSAVLSTMLYAMFARDHLAVWVLRV